ncbi:peptidylprolyl isomerase [Candidatus Woesearchaeota archaeon]|nr:peptidylprolyl isomerase [Candidatus Woesearchaeota archaeon]
MTEKKKSKHSAHKSGGTHHEHHSGSRRKKESGPNYVFGIVVFLILVAVVAGIIWLSSKSGEQRIAGQLEVAAVVNGEKITMSYLDERYDMIHPAYRNFITKGRLLNETIIGEVLFLQAADAAGIVVSDEDLAEEIDMVILQAGITEEDFEAKLAQQNMSREVFEEIYQKQIIMMRLLDQEVFADIQVDESDIQKAYDEKIHAMHILVESESEAYDIIEELKKSTLSSIVGDFQDLAEERSTDPSAAGNGGDLGEFGRGVMVPAFEKAAFALEEYAFTAEPVMTQFGYHIILRVPKESSFEEEYAQIEEALLTQAKAAAVPGYLAELRENAEIEVFYEDESLAAE